MESADLKAASIKQRFILRRKGEGQNLQHINTGQFFTTCMLIISKHNV